MLFWRALNINPESEFQTDILKIQIFVSALAYRKSFVVSRIFDEPRKFSQQMFSWAVAFFNKFYTDELKFSPHLDESEPWNFSLA